MSNEFFLVRFSDVDDYHRAAFKGPWKIFDYYITVAQWTPDFNEDEPMNKILTWVRLTILPIHFFNHTTINRIGNQMGRIIRMDLSTSEGARGRYARVCVEIDLSKPPLSFSFYVEYESLENVSHSCGVYSHKIDACLSLSPPKEVVPPVGNPPTFPAGEVKETDTRSWMTVTRRRHSKKATKRVDEAAPYNGSYFSIPQHSPTAVVDEPKPVGKEDSDQMDGVETINQLTTITVEVFSKVGTDVIGQPRPPLGDKTNQVLTGGKPQ
ncbi:hypothetical protein LINPERHAP2_LOCUS16910 [Linum perenne]